MHYQWVYLPLPPHKSEGAQAHTPWWTGLFLGNEMLLGRFWSLLVLWCVFTHGGGGKGC